MSVRSKWLIAGLGVSLVVLIALEVRYGFLYRGHELQAAATASGAETPNAATSKPARKLLFYRNPMGLPDTSSVPKKDPMGMDYIAVYEGEDQEDSSAQVGLIRISTEKIQKLGVRTEAARVQKLERIVRAAGRVEPDERRIYTISPKFEGYLERLHVNVTGQTVAKGQVLFEVYSPELISAQREYLIALQGLQSAQGSADSVQSGMRRLADASLQRLRNWDISEEQISSLTQSGEVRRTLAIRSPVQGLVTEKKALQGMRFMPGEALYQVTDLGAVWVVADVFEQDIGLVKTGAKVKVTINAYPDKSLSGIVTYVYPTLNPETRTIPVRIELSNPDMLLKPAMFAQIELSVGTRTQTVTVPNSAVIDSGTRQLVLVQVGEGRFEPREVRLGRRASNEVEVLDGVRNGEIVVVSANFLIDAESNLKAAVSGFGHAGHGSSADAGQKPSSETPKAATTGHRAEGAIESIDLKNGTVEISHGPVLSLKWPAMSMEFAVANSGLLQGYKPGDMVAFEFVERKPGEWVVTALRRAAPAHDAAAHKSR